MDKTKPAEAGLCYMVNFTLPLIIPVLFWMSVASDFIDW